MHTAREHVLVNQWQAVAQGGPPRSIIIRARVHESQAHGPRTTKPILVVWAHCLILTSVSCMHAREGCQHLSCAKTNESILVH